LILNNNAYNSIKINDITLVTKTFDECFKKFSQFKKFQILHDKLMKKDEKMKKIKTVTIAAFGMRKSVEVSVEV
jgi:hypothetical protein